MKPPFFYLAVAGVLCAETPAADFSRDIAPILIRECLACHGAEKAKGGYRAHTFAAVLKAGKSDKPPVIAGHPAESELFKRLIAHDEDDRMPQDDDPLSSAQIELFRDWIASGAKLDRGDAEASLASLAPKAPHPAPPEFYERPLPVLALAFTPDGKRLAVGGHREITFWNLAGQLQQRVTNAPRRVHAISFGTNASLFAIAGGTPGRGGELSVYRDGQFLTNLAQTADVLLTVAFSADGKFLAGGGSDNAIRVFNTETWENVATIQQHADWVTSVSFSGDGKRILSASRDRTARIYGAESGELETTYVNHGAAVYSAVFLSDEKVASAGREKSVHLWDIKEGKKRNEIGGASGEIYELIARDGFIFAASGDGQVRQYSAKDRKLIRAYKDGPEAVYSIAFDAAGGRLAAGSYDGTVRIWNVKDGKEEAGFLAAPLRRTAQANSASR